MSMAQWLESKRRSKTPAEQLLIDYKEVFGSEAGKRVLHDLEKQTTFGSGSMAHKPIDVNILIWQEAQRNMFVYILKQIHKVPKEERKVDNG